MPVHPTRRRPRSRHLGGFWRQAYSWRWDAPHPVPKKEQRWYITAHAALKVLREQEGIDTTWLRNFITWYFTWWTFHGKVDAASMRLYSEHPRTLLARSQDGTYFILEAYKAWTQQYAHMLAQASIPEIAQQYRTVPHTTHHPGPWETEDVD